MTSFQIGVGGICNFVGYTPGKCVVCVKHRSG